MTPEEAKLYIQGNVRIKPTARGGGSHQHYGRAKLLRVDGRRAIVKPWGHGSEVALDLDDVIAWKAGNPELFTAKPAQSQPQTQPEKENPMSSQAVAPARPASAPISSTYTPDLYLEAMQALKELADAEQMAKEAAEMVVKSRDKWRGVKVRLDERAA